MADVPSREEFDNLDARLKLLEGQVDKLRNPPPDRQPVHLVATRSEIEALVRQASSNVFVQPGSALESGLAALRRSLES
jgi:hypothetical protein